MQIVSHRKKIVPLSRKVERREKRKEVNISWKCIAYSLHNNQSQEE